jgi:hypothetical protein
LPSLKVVRKNIRQPLDFSRVFQFYTKSVDKRVQICRKPAAKARN